MAPVEAFGTGYSALTWDDSCASLREIICEIDMAAAGAGSRYHSRDCNLLQLVQGILEDPILLQAVADQGQAAAGNRGYGYTCQILKV